MPLPPPPARWVLPTALAVAILSMASFAALTYVQSLGSASRWVAHTREVRENLNILTARVLEGEAQRTTWLRSRRADDRHDLRTALAEVDSTLERLRALLADNALQLSRLERIEVLSRARLGDAAPTRNARSTAGGGVDLADAMKRLIAEMLNDEDRLLDQRLADFNAASRVTSWSTLALGALSALLIIGLQYRAWRHSRRQQRLNHALEDKERALQQALEALRQADRRKDEFLAMLSHELRNPLAPIRNAVGILRRTGSDDPVAHQSTAILERQVTHMVRLVDDLLDVARITRGDIRLQHAQVDLAEVVRAALEAATPAIERFGHRLSLALPQDPLYVEGDAMRLAQVLINLLNNAAKYTPPGGQIEVHLQREAGEACLSVTDSGPGIPPEQLERAFEMFNRLGRLDEPTRSGLGVGLALARNLVELHGGRLEAANRAPAPGCEFRVRLPLGPVGPGQVPLAEGALAGSA